MIVGVWSSSEYNSVSSLLESTSEVEKFNWTFECFFEGELMQFDLYAGDRFCFLWNGERNGVNVRQVIDHFRRSIGVLENWLIPLFFQRVLDCLCSYWKCFLMVKSGLFSLNVPI